MLGFNIEGLKNEYEYELKLEIQSSQIRTSFNNPTTIFLD